MNKLESHLEVASHLLHQSQARRAVKHVRAAQKILEQSKNPRAVSHATIACRLIDCGSDLKDETLVQEGLHIFETHYENFSTTIDPANLEYNIANAKKSLYDISRIANAHRSLFNPNAIPLLTDAKDHYWQAFKSLTNRKLEPQLFVNLGDTLDQCCRVIEALCWYDLAIGIYPDFGMAHLNRGLALEFLNRISGEFTIIQLNEARKSFQLAEISKDVPYHEKKTAHHLADAMNKRLTERGWNASKIAEQAEQHKHEYESHDPYWRFCLSHYLALNEHALYCQCSASRRDNLSIPTQTGALGGTFVPRLELLLNRIKSEFCLARALFCQAAFAEQQWDTHLFEGTFTELHDNEATGLRCEFLRASFRLCFGILDRIALGVCELFDLAQPGEKIHFENFWRPPDQKKIGEERWQKINQQHNFGLVALYSIATDLNRRGGQWGFFKEHRNKLEHGLLILLQDGTNSLPSFVIPERIAIDQVPLTTFKGQTLLMLQLTASAIFSFVFCVREEGRRALVKAPTNQVKFGKKAIGKS
jgi:hypothetical protein